MLVKSEDCFCLSDFLLDFFSSSLTFGALILIYIISDAASLGESGGYINNNFFYSYVLGTLGALIVIYCFDILFCEI